MNIRDLLELNAGADGAIDFTYTEVADPDLGGTPGRIVTGKQWKSFQFIM